MRTGQDGGSAWARDLWHVTQLEYDRQKLQFMRRYQKIDFPTYDRLLTEQTAEIDAYYAKWDAQGKDAGDTFRKMIAGRAQDNLPKLAREYLNRYGSPPENPGVPAQYGPTFRQIADHEFTMDRFKTLLWWAGGIFLLWWALSALGSGTGTGRYKPPKPEVSDNFGTADYATVQKGIPNANYPLGGVFFGKSASPEQDPEDWITAPGSPIVSTPEHHTLIIAPTRTGKGTRVLVPTLLKYIGSMCVIDVKGELAAITGRPRKNVLPDLPFLTLVLNPWGVLKDEYKALGIPGARYNPLDILDRNDPNVVAKAQTLANTILPPPAAEKDRFWQGNAANILTAVLLWLTDQPGETKTLARAREITSLSRRQFSDEYISKMAASRAFDGAISELISPFIDLANETYSGVMANLSEGMRFLSDPQLKKATASSTFSMKDLIELPISLYVVIPPERMDTQRTWLRLIISALTTTFKTTPMEGRTGHRCMLMIDELPALGRMTDLPRDLATMAGYGLDYTLAVQGIDQLKDLYKEGAATIMGNCAWKWFCNLKDLESAKYLSDSLGKKTVQTIGKSKSSGSSPTGETAGESTTFGETGRNLLNPDEALNLGRDVAIVLNPITRPFYVHPVDYWDMPEAFYGYRKNYPQLYWDPPLRYDPNPYIKSSASA